jgi:hypothetical protein
VFLLEECGVFDPERLLKHNLPDDLHPIAVAVFALSPFVLSWSM